MAGNLITVGPLTRAVLVGLYSVLLTYGPTRVQVSLLISLLRLRPPSNLSTPNTYFRRVAINDARIAYSLIANQMDLLLHNVVG